MSRAIDAGLALVGIVLLLGITGTMERYDQERLAEHVAQRDREIAREAARAAALRRQAEWAELMHRGQRLTNFPEIARK